MPRISIPESVVVTLPLPRKELSPNHTVGSRGGRMAKARIVKSARQMAWASALQTGFQPQWKQATTRITFYVPDKRRRDGDNALGSCKAYLDGLADAGIVANDHGFTHMPVQFVVSKNRVRVEIEITPAA